MHAVDQRQRLLFQRFGRGDVGEDHELLDQAMRVEPLRHDHPIDRAVRFQHDLALGQFQIERIALVARALHRGIGVVQRAQHGLQQRAGDVIGAAVDRGLRLRISEFRRRAHQDAMERMRALAAIGSDHDPHRQRAARLARFQRAQIVGNALRQHRHHPVREVHRIAALQGVAVERGAGAHIVSDVGDRDGEDEAAFIGRIGIRLGMHRVVMILGVRRIDGDQRDFAPILAAFQRRGLGIGDFGERGHRKILRDFVAMDRDQTDGFFGGERAEPFTHPARGQPETAAAHDGDADEVAVLRVAGIMSGDVQLAAGLFLVDRLQPSAAARQRAEDAEHAALAVVDQLDDAATIGNAVAALVRLDAQQHAVANAGDEFRPHPPRNMQQDFGRRAVLLIPFARAGE